MNFAKSWTTTMSNLGYWHNNAGQEFQYNLDTLAKEHPNVIVAIYNGFRYFGDYSKTPTPSTYTPATYTSTSPCDKSLTVDWIKWYIFYLDKFNNGKCGSIKKCAGDVDVTGKTC